MPDNLRIDQTGGAERSAGGKSNMDWLSKACGADPKEETQGIHLKTDGPYWEIDAPD